MEEAKKAESHKHRSQAIKKKYSNISSNDSKKNGSALAGGPLDTSFADANRKEFNSENEVGEDIEYNDVSSDEQRDTNEKFL